MIKPISIQLSPTRIGRILASVVALLVFANLVAVYIAYHLELDDLYGLPTLFLLDHERNIPTIFSSLLFFTIGSLALAIPNLVMAQRSRRRVWQFVAAVSIFLGLDEFMMIHEYLSAPTREILRLDGKLNFAWVLPYGLLLLFVGVASWRLFMSLPKIVRVSLLVSAALFVSGAVGIELAGQGLYEVRNSGYMIQYLLLTTVEEALELAGLSTAIFALYKFISMQDATLHFSVQLRESVVHVADPQTYIGRKRTAPSGD